MKLYADAPSRRLRQIVGDLLFVAWIALWIRLAGVVHDATLQLTRPGRFAADTANSVSRELTAAGQAIADVPLVGDDAARPFDGLSQTALQMAQAGQDSVRAVENLAYWLAIVVAVIPIAIIVAVYLPLRVRFVRRATAGQRFIDSGADLDLFALRALARQPMHVLGRIHDDPAGAWRRGDPEVIRSLAVLELKAVGLKPPRG